jgi:preprotein translocase subunit SecB
VKDLSFENPGNRSSDGRPNIDLGIDVSAMPHEQGNGIYEISLKLTAKAHTEDTTLFLIELDYGGLFQCVDMTEEETEASLLIECPRLLFPFARRLIADVTREGGFPPLLIDPVDFVQLYRQQKQQQAQGGTAPPPPPQA